MSIAASVRSVSPAARTLTEGGRLVAFKSLFAPATQVANAYQSNVQPNQRRFSERLAMESEDQFAAANEVVVGAERETISDNVAQMVRAVQAMAFTARNVIVPTVDQLVNQFAAKQNSSVQPNVSVNVFKYHEVHSAPALVNHVAGKYADVQGQESYRSFILTGMTPEAVVSLVAENNPHLDQPLVVEWLLGVGADRIAAVWNKLYGSSRDFDFTTATWMHSSNWPTQIDELLLAYCLTGALREKPQEVMGESVQLDEWENALGNLHELIGSKLLKAYEYRAQDTKTQRLVIATDAKDAMRTGQVSTLVNGDVYNGWLQAGGDVQALLGLAVFEPNLKKVSEINAVAADLSARWAKYYPVLRQACADNALRDRRKDVVSVFLSSSQPAVEGLPAMDSGVVSDRLDAELRAQSDDAYDKPCQMFAALVCRVYYPTQPLYCDFMRSMDRYSRVHPGASGRELAIEATIELVATWLASQITTVKYTPEVDPNAVSQEDEAEANVAIDKDNAGIAENVGPVAEPEPVNEVEEAAAGGEVDADGNPIVPAEDGTGLGADGEQTEAPAGETPGDTSELPDDGQSAGFPGTEPESELPAPGETPVEPDFSDEAEEGKTQQ
ncbi:hypothetical protein FDI21_gp193 [Pseudomonas phage Noxifer]|uniref:Uncharacterized protein n=1 Tax=Pseudomonas phage Noxifer TaxID=2006684 RepID=A0A1Y0SV20_9CAUD|nr:hypothetical protein FDI21_gp193 [Pseudomonas phage Noxifer]ARV77362.1 hypothetical protein NOXIFER_193 [Pseudomonas phage Noxifer]